ncbi:alpha/beta fold hydrolase [Rhizorhabdus histidinilytica]|uniref:alpha/beta fold hydrolase n=1 Tax=Rhizorhabdus histidinilytica TaxID=439228 RepID=UPI0032208F0E
MSKTFVLIHGAWRGGWCYARTAALLRASGHRVFAPTLTGLGERSHLAAGPVGFRTHVDDVANLLRWEGLDDVVLCGHSYGGMVAAAVADAMPDRIAALLFLDAILPEAGKSLLDICAAEEVAAGLLRSAAANGGRLVPPLPATLFGLNEADMAMVEALCTPHPLPCFCEPVELTGAWERIARKTYVRATGWAGYAALGFDPMAKVEAGAGWSTIDVACGHEVALDAPERLADMLLNA